VPLRIHDDRLTRRVGAGVLVVAVMTVLFVTTIYSRLGRGGVEVHVHFGDASGVRQGAPVVVAGRQVGRIARIRIADGGGIIVTAAIEPAWAARIPVNAEVFISSRGLLSPRWLEIGAPPHHALPGRPLVEGDALVGVDPPNLDRLLQTLWADLTEIKLFVDALRPAAARLGLSIARLSTAIPSLHLDLGGVVEEAERVLSDLESTGLDPDRLGALVARAQALGDREIVALVDDRAQLAAIRAAAPALPSHGDLDALLALADTTLADVRGAIAEATTGTGSLAMLLGDLELIDDVKAMTMALKRHPWRVMAPPVR
jgi:phospholipid/cholesterol/gamma-HCH transport system substrate-binding protein